MDLSPTASRFDNSISSVAAVGDEAALSLFDRFGADAVYARNRELSESLRAVLSDIGWTAVDLPEGNRSTIVSVPFGDEDPGRLLDSLRGQGVVSATRTMATCAYRSTSTTTRTAARSAAWLPSDHHGWCTVGAAWANRSTSSDRPEMPSFANTCVR